jgi:hypothetical protein
MEVRELARGLWRWEAPHPGWEPNPEPDSPADWPQLVGCVAYGTDDMILTSHGEPVLADAHAALDRALAA